jgi:23S rRNA (cytidine1920-2'-O)/16S rRNA (cytidine1409-2'-O)-methyltransferase
VSPTKKKKGGTKRLDGLLVERGLAESIAKARAMILAGKVRVESQPGVKAGALLPITARIEIIGEASRYASRGGMKLEGALEDFGVSVADKICLDVGASTGGFTDCLLQHGARRVYALDVSSDQLAWQLRKDPRVVLVERNARYLRPSDIDNAAVEIVTVDVSFISVATILPAVVAAAGSHAELLILVKPQFELPRGDVGAGGIVRDASLHERAIERVRVASVAAGLSFAGVRASRLAGAEGNQEFFIHALGPQAIKTAS